MRPAVGQLLFHRRVHRNLALRVMSIDAVHASQLKAPLREKSSQLARKQDVDIGGQHESAASPADTNILGDHLVERQGFGMSEAAVQLLRHFNETNLARAHLLRPAQHFGQARPVGRRVPFHDDQFGWNLIAPRLPYPAIDESLHTYQRISAMVVVARRHHQRKIRFAG